MRLPFGGVARGVRTAKFSEFSISSAVWPGRQAAIIEITWILARNACQQPMFPCRHQRRACEALAAPLRCTCTLE